MTVDAVNLLACLDAWRRERPQQQAVIGYDVKRSREAGRPVRRGAVTTLELWREVLAAATGLHALGIRSGDVVAVQLPNWKEYLVAHLAAYALGAITTPISPILRQRDVSRQLEIGRAAALVVPAVFGSFDYIGMARELQAQLGLRCVIAVGAEPGEGVVGWDAMQRDGAAETLAAERDAIARGDFVRRVDEVTVVNFSSGTSGEPKGVMHSTKTIASCIVPCIDVLQLTADDILLVVPTLGHGSGILNGLYLPLLLRATVVYLDGWDAEVALRVIDRERVTYGPVMPTYLFDLAALPSQGGVDVSSWKTGRVSGGAIPRGIMKTIQERLPGLRLCPGWGMSETFWSTCGSPDDPLDKRNSTDGRCVGDCRIEIRDPTCTRELPVGDVGDIVISSSALMLGYYRQDELTRSCFTADGWFKTGDLGRVDDEGYLTIAGRSKDLVIRGGENVPVVEVEALLMEHPKVKGVAVVGVPDARLGEKVCAVVEARDASQPLTFDEMTRFLADKQLTRHFIPQHLLLVDELPRTPVGKLMKQRVREEAARRLAPP